MFKKLIAGFLLCMSFGAIAGNTVIDTSGLNEAQIAELKSIAAQKAADAAKQAAGDTVTAKDPGAMATMAATWGQQAAVAAEGFAKALAIAARELGVTINDFLHTDAGKFTALIIIWKVAGAAIIKFLYGMVFFTCGMTMVRVIYTKLFTDRFEQVEYSRFGGFFKGTKIVRVPKSIGGLKSDGEWLAFWVMIIATGLTLGITGAIIT